MVCDLERLPCRRRPALVLRRSKTLAWPVHRLAHSRSFLIGQYRNMPLHVLFIFLLVLLLSPVSYLIQLITDKTTLPICISAFIYVYYVCSEVGSVILYAVSPILGVYANNRLRDLLDELHAILLPTTPDLCKVLFLLLTTFGLKTHATFHPHLRAHLGKT